MIVPCWLEDSVLKESTLRVFNYLYHLSCESSLRLFFSRAMAATRGESSPSNYDRMKELKEFDETKAGVKGLIDSGIKRIPRIFVNPPEKLPKPSDLCHDKSLQVPIIDLQGLDDPNRRKDIIGQVCEASERWGFFQLVNHGIPTDVLDSAIQGTKRFHEQDKEVKAELYTRDLSKNVRYESNFYLYAAPTADWRDTFTSVFYDGCLDNFEQLPSILRKEMGDYLRGVMGSVADTLCELLSEGLGLPSNYLKSINMAKSQFLVAHYYPPCPEPELTFGTTKHSDPSFLTLLLQDKVGGLQVLHQSKWVDVSPIHGALVVNIGDILQLVSNGKFLSAQHRVLTSNGGPRISVAVFFFPRMLEEKPCGPIKELLSHENPPLYKEILLKDYAMLYGSKELEGKSVFDHLRL